MIRKSASLINADERVIEKNAYRKAREDKRVLGGGSRKRHDTRKESEAVIERDSHNSLLTLLGDRIWFN